MPQFPVFWPKKQVDFTSWKKYCQFVRASTLSLADTQLTMNPNTPPKASESVLFQYDGKRGLSRKAQAYFRIVFHNHINLSAIADQKANIMISVNSILISVLISFLTYRNVADTQPMILLPVVIFMVTGLASLIFAVLSARPKVTMLNKTGQDLDSAGRNIVFFGNFVPLGEENFEIAMDQLLRDSSLMYGNLSRDLYHLGQVLDKKYRYLTASYNIFMLGFAATVICFLVALLWP
jgi:hypothetical protein